MRTMAEFSKCVLMIHLWGTKTPVDRVTSLMSLHHVGFISQGVVTQQSALH